MAKNHSGLLRSSWFPTRGQGGLILMIQTLRQNSFLPSIRAFKILVISSLKNVQNENEDKSPAI